MVVSNFTLSLIGICNHNYYCFHLYPDGVAWDWVNYKLYWTDAEEKDIEVLDPVRSGSYRKVFLQTGPTSIPRALVLDPSTRCAELSSLHV